MQSIADEQLLEIGLSNKDIRSLRKLNYAEEIKKRSSLPEETLRAYGYNDEEIKNV